MNDGIDYRDLRPIVARDRRVNNRKRTEDEIAKEIFSISSLVALRRWVRDRTPENREKLIEVAKLYDEQCEKMGSKW